MITLKYSLRYKYQNDIFCVENKIFKKKTHG